ncbi:hypothetical protein J3Q64DRAFT_1743795 [Phycomyces blakesleeanus]|uniref:NADH dehydrogenase [ubiquinone] 1 alpha subcomplex subunit n=1 Tax=Phycomyces blakesleeanus TaxID=4837 RepID=A0ABR3B2A5_PHYBL
MSRPASSFLQRFSEVYKTVRFPWKKHALVGKDLEGNEYWEMPNPLGGRVKRWVQMKDHDDMTLLEQSHLPVQWHAWLRHTRPTPPSIQELVMEERRKAIVQGRAKKLDDAWAERKLQIEREEAAEPAKMIERGSPPEDASVEDASSTKKTSRPTGQGDTFVPGEWQPNAPRRR